MVKFAINGFGRLGRQLLKIAITKSKQKSVTDAPKLVLVNDHKVPLECLAYMIKNDTYYGKFPCDVSQTESSLTIDGIKIGISQEKVIGKVPWTESGAEYVIDTTGDNVNCASASKFLATGVKRVIVTGCSNIPMFVVGVNHACFTKEMKCVSAATPSMNCLAIMLKILHEHFELEEAMATGFYPLNSSDNILDDPRPGSCRASRSAVSSYMPTGATTKRKFVDKIMPELEGKTESAAIKIPVPCVGAIDLTAKFKKEAPLDIIKCKLKEASDSHMKEVLSFTNEELVSADIIGNPHSCVIDGTAAVAFSRCMAKIFAWYDAENAYANRLYDLTKYIASRDC